MDEGKRFIHEVPDSISKPNFILLQQRAAPYELDSHGRDVTREYDRLAGFPRVPIFVPQDSMVGNLQTREGPAREMRRRHGWKTLVHSRDVMVAVPRSGKVLPWILVEELKPAVF
jgi:hypothetical protein